MSKQRAGDGRSDSGGIPVPPATIRAFLKSRGICAIAAPPTTASSSPAISAGCRACGRCLVGQRAHRALDPPAPRPPWRPRRPHRRRPAEVVDHRAWHCHPACQQRRRSDRAALDQARRTGKLAAFNRAYAALTARRGPKVARCRLMGAVLRDCDRSCLKHRVARSMPASLSERC